MKIETFNVIPLESKEGISIETPKVVEIRTSTNNKTKVELSFINYTGWLNDDGSLTETSLRGRDIRFYVNENVNLQEIINEISNKYNVNLELSGTIKVEEI